MALTHQLMFVAFIIVLVSDFLTHRTCVKPGKCCFYLTVMKQREMLLLEGASQKSGPLWSNAFRAPVNPNMVFILRNGSASCMFWGLEKRWLSWSPFGVPLNK